MANDKPRFNKSDDNQNTTKEIFDLADQVKTNLDEARSLIAAARSALVEEHCSADVWRNCFTELDTLMKKTTATFNEIRRIELMNKKLKLYH